MNLFEIKNLKISYPGKEILEDIHVTIKEHEIVCVMGNSGCGKSTFLSALNGFLKENGGNYSGEILYRGKNIQEMKLEELRKKVSTLFQDSKPFSFSIEKNLLYAMEFYEGRIKDKKNRVRELLEAVNLYEEVKDGLKSSPEKLSGGQRQRLCIARMLTTNPEVLILDEPCSSLDIKNTKVIEKLLVKLSNTYTILISTHNMEQAKRIADRILFIENKNIIEQDMTKR